MHSGVIEGGGFMGMDQLEVDGKILGCIFVGDLDRIQYADFNPVYAPWNPGTLEPWNPGKYCSNLTLSTETQDSFHQSTTS